MQTKKSHSAMCYRYNTNTGRYKKNTRWSKSLCTPDNYSTKTTQKYRIL